MAGERKRSKRPKAKEPCPRCGQETEQVLECPVCHREGCTERCNAGGVGTPCNKCDEKGADEDVGGEGPEPGEEQ